MSEASAGGTRLRQALILGLAALVLDAPLAEAKGEAHDAAGPNEAHDAAGPNEAHDAAGPDEAHDAAELDEAHDAAELGEAHDAAGPGERRLDLVYSGGLGGIGTTRARFELQDRLGPALLEAGLVVDSVQGMHGLLAQDDLEIWPEDGSIASALAYAAGPSVCDEGVLVPTARTPTERFVTAPGSPELPVRDAALEPRRWQRCEAAGVSAIALSDPEGPGASGRLLNAYDMRTAFRWSAGPSRWIQIARPRGEPGRRAGVIREALRGHPGALFADAGDFVDPGHGVGDPQWRARRAAGFALLTELRPAALGVGAAELGEGVAAFLIAAGELPYVATNWRWGDGPPAIPPVRRVTVPGDQPLDVAFLAVTDPSAVDGSGGLSDAGVTLTDPVDAVNTVVDALATSAHPPDLVILLAHVPPLVQAALRQSLRGVDLLLGDPTAATLRVADQRTDLLPFGAAYKAAPITLPLDGVAAAQIAFDPRPSWVAVQPLDVSAAAPSDPSVTSTATALRAARATPLDRALVPADSPLAGVSEARWRKLVCEAVLATTGADVAFVGALPRALPSPGPLSALQVADRLAGGHVLEVHRADGDRLARFLYAAHDAAPIHCGAPTGVVAPKAQGRPIDPRRTYRVATTDLTRLQTRLDELLPNASSSLVGHQPKFVALRGADGAPLTLDRAVLDAFDAAAQSTDWVRTWEERSGADVTPQWLLALNRLSFQMQRFEGPKTTAYAGVPESALSSPSSFTLGANLDVALEMSSRHVSADLRVAATYSSFAVDGLPVAETADAWRASTSIQLPVAALPPRAPLQLMPFAELGFDSEFTPGPGDAAPLPRRADLSVFGGLSAARVAGLRSFRVGPFVNRDLGHLDDKLTEFGGRFLGSTAHSPLPLSALQLTTAWDMQVFAPTAQDDASDLRLRLWGEIRCAVQLLRSLAIAAYVQGLLVQGRVEATSVPTGTVTAGFALDLAAILRLDLRPIERSGR